MSNRTRRTLAAAAFASLAMGVSGTAGAAGAEPAGSWWEGNHKAFQNDGDKGGRSLYESIDTIAEDHTLVAASFRALGEHLTIYDFYDNDRPTIVKLWVGGGGPAIFYHSDRVTEFDLSYAEGQTVYLQVCTSDSPNAACTSKVTYPGMT